MPFQDIREFISKGSQVDKLVHSDNSDWDLDIGGLTEIATKSAEPHEKAKNGRRHNQQPPLHKVGNTCIRTSSPIKHPNFPTGDSRQGTPRGWRHISCEAQHNPLLGKPLCLLAQAL